MNCLRNSLAGRWTRTDDLRDAEAADRVSRHIAGIVARAIDQAPEGQRSAEAVRIASELISRLQALIDAKPELDGDQLLDPAQVLVALLRRLPDGSAEPIERPLTPLLDTTVFTNAPGEPAVGHELRAEVPSADAIDVVMAFIRWSGVRPLIDVLRRHCEAGKPLRILTTTYTNSTEQRALDELARLGAEIRVSYDTSSTRLHAKAGSSTARAATRRRTSARRTSRTRRRCSGSSGTSASRRPGTRTPSAKMAAVFASYWESGDFVAYDRDEFARTDAEVAPTRTSTLLSPDRDRAAPVPGGAARAGRPRPPPGPPPQPARRRDRDRQDGDGGGRLRAPSAGTRRAVACSSSPTARRSSTRAGRRSATPCGMPRSARCGCGGQRPTRFEHVFASIQSLHARRVRAASTRRTSTS